jgi:hypothetical protein
VQVQHEVLQVYEQQLLEKENSGVSALLRDDKVRPWALFETNSTDSIESLLQTIFKWKVHDMLLWFPFETNSIESIESLLQMSTKGHQRIR